jgi:3'-5' exoribonuclease
VITTSFLVHSKEIRQKKSGELYLSLLLGDRTGDLDAKMWDNVNDVVDDFDRDDFVKVKGLIQVFHNRPQLTIHKVRRMDDSEIDFVDYFPSSRRDPEEMWTELRGIVESIGNLHLKGLLDALLNDEDVSRRFRRAPAAKQIHHAYLGGLIEHVLSLCALARMTAAHYPNVDLDLLLTGVVLHDIGKIYELNYERGFSYSNDGQLLGHINIGLRMVADKARSLPDFPAPLRSLVDHMILSHHGQLEFGSPKLPQFPEALLLHFLDDLDSKMECMRALIDNDRQVEGCFTTYNAALTRAALKKDRYLSGAPSPERVRPATEAVRPGPNGGTRPNGEARANGAGAQSKGDARLNGAGAQPDGDVRPNGAEPVAASKPPTVPVPPVAKPEVATQHPLFGPKSDSPFADKLKQALLPAPKQEN